MPLPNLSAGDPVVDAAGRPTRYFQALINTLVAALNIAGPLAAGAVPSSRGVVAAGGLQGGGTLGDEVGLSLYSTVTTVAALPTTGNSVGDFAYAADGRKPGESAGAGTGVPVWWDGAHWYAVCSGAVVAA
jgi:hypothetical protein